MMHLVLIKQEGNSLRLTRYKEKSRIESAILDVKDVPSIQVMKETIEDYRENGLPEDDISA